MMALASGNLEKQPFSEEVVEKMRTLMADRVGVPEAERGVASGQCFRLGILSRLLRALDDPDWKFVGDVASGFLWASAWCCREPQLFTAPSGSSTMPR